MQYQFPPGSSVRTEPKTPRSRRTIPLPAVVAEALAAHIATYPPGGDGSLFTVDGKPWTHRLYSPVFKAAVQRAGLPGTISSHDLRHHYASVLLLAGESVVAVAERLGHSNAALVMSTYGHLVRDTEDRVRQAVDSAWSSSGARESLTRR